MKDAAVLAALLRSDLRFFAWKSFQTILPGTAYFPNWHVDAIVHHLMRVHAGDIPRLLINQPPRSLKSICVSVAYVAWLLGHDPTRRATAQSAGADMRALIFEWNGEPSAVLTLQELHAGENRRVHWGSARLAALCE
jgi:hypothetical protein